jgi:hypothetical protein
MIDYMNSPSIKEWVHGEHNLIGMLLAYKNEETNAVVIGWSKCCKRDQFSKDKAEFIAFNRILNGSHAALPFAIEPLMENFILRCQKYFRCENVVVQCKDNKS